MGSGDASAAERQVPAAMGAVVVEGGVHFRVWAPAASAVYVCGSFNDWSRDAAPLAAEGEGRRAGFVEGAKAGDTYRYRICSGEQELWRNDPYAREVTHSAGDSRIVDTAFDWGPHEFVTPPWNELVIYELHVGTFNVTEAGRPGTFRSVIERLDYLKDLGINAVEIMPPTEFPGGFSWGYNPAHPFALESDYGGVDDFRALVRAAHDAGIAVILDVVYNHFGPDDLDLWRFDGWHEGDGGGVYFYNDWRSQTPWGHTRPDYGRPEVRRYIRDNAMMWLDDYRVDGLRTDALAYVRNVHGGTEPGADLPDGRSLMQGINHEIRERFPWKLSLAEDMRGNPDVTRPTTEGGEGFSAQWDSDFVHPVRAQLTAARDDDRSMAALARALSNRFNGDPFQRVVYTESHDEVANGRARVAEEIAPGNVDDYFARKRSILAMVLVLTAPGIPMLFQGQALNEAGYFSDHRPIDWSLLERHPGHVALARDLIRLRRDLDGTSRGLTGPHLAVLRADDEHKALIVHRFRDGGPGDSVVVVMNFSAQTREALPVGLPGAGLWRVRFNSDAKLYYPDFNGVPVVDLTAEPGECDGQPFHASLTLPPYAAVILSVDRG